MGKTTACFWYCIVLAALALVSGRALADELLAPLSLEETASIEETVADLAARVDSLEAENAALRSLPCVAQPSREEVPSHKINFAGRIHVDYWAFPGDSPGVNAFESGDSTISPQDRLELRRARFAAFGDLPADMIYKLDFELSEASDPEFRDLYIGWENHPLFGKLLFGNQKRPYGLDHLNSSNLNVMLERPLVVQAFNRNNRRFGLATHGLSSDEAWNWRYGLFNLRELQTDGQYASDHYQLEFAGRIARSAYDRCDESRYVHLALSGNYARPDGTPAPGREENQARFRTEPEARTDSTWLDTGVIDGADAFGIFGIENVVNFGRLQLTGEYMNLWLDREPGFGDPVHFHGGYLQLAFFLTDHYQPWDREWGVIGRVRPLAGDAWCPALQAAVRWSYADLSSDDVQGGVGETLTAAFNWYFTPRARLQMNCVYGEITDRAPVDGFTAGTFTTLGTRVMVDF